jgi:hypothetical protein
MATATVRLWVKNRGTVPTPAELIFSVLVQENALCDDVKKAISREVSAVFSNVPSAAFNVYYWNPSSEDYIAIPADHAVGVNPLPEILKDAPGSALAAPLFFDFTWQTTSH